MLKKFYKLFYLIGMAIPLFALLPCVFYFAFNEKASDYTSTEVISTTQYETNEVNSVDDIKVGNIYKFNLTLNGNNALTLLNDSLSCNIINYKLENIITYNNTISYSVFEIVNLSNIDYLTFTIFQTGNTHAYIGVIGSDTTDDTDALSMSTKETLITKFEFQFYIVFNVFEQQELQLFLDNNCIFVSDYLGETTYQVIESDFNPSNVLYNSFDLTSQYLEKGVFNINGKPIFSGWFAELLGTNLGADMSGYSAINYLLLYLDYALMFNIIFIGFRSLTWLTDMVIKCFDRGFN